MQIYHHLQSVRSSTRQHNFYRNQCKCLKRESQYSKAHRLSSIPLVFVLQDEVGEHTSFFFSFFLLQLNKMRNARLQGLVIHHNPLFCVESMSAWFVFSTDNLWKSCFVLNWGSGVDFLRLMPSNLEPKRGSRDKRGELHEKPSTTKCLLLLDEHFFAGGGGAGAEGMQGWYELVYVAVRLNLSELRFL